MMLDRRLIKRCLKEIIWEHDDVMVHLEDRNYSINVVGEYYLKNEVVKIAARIDTRIERLKKRIIILEAKRIELNEAKEQVWKPS